ncbi:COG3500 Phage protein D [uncultured Caudovirales phage]|uniref:COG3500 Phage protein D n=1 Tax=uncultured Caudovirales phage TaxID=2100421 RepID=A0A6J5PYV0_9CAUD|nr:COG3500 Phage protein D [uncultured Caudovirales phage]CAB4179747.1 COG3500 Phage protein D [uncultured Caudovirales phage]CAB4188863.1 COG3500 Phage protein D [uncultured Caudovirales phage]
MADNVVIRFPDSVDQPTAIYSVNLYQNRFAHEMVSVVFKDWGLAYDNISYGSPVQMAIAGTGSSRQFYGYVYFVNPIRTPGTNYTEVILIGGSFPMKASGQAVYKDITADQVIQQIADKHGLVSYVVPHDRVFEQIAQTGHTDWELMVRLAHQCGYSLRTENTEIYFQPLLEDYTKYRSEAIKFVMNSSNEPGGSSMYSFEPIVGESTEFDDAQKAAVAISGTDRFGSGAIKAVHTRNKTTRRKSQVESFDRFDTSVVANSVEIAQSEAKAAEDRNSFPYRAKVKVIGTPTLRPDMPVFLDGVGNTYSGFWIVLSTEHEILETELNRYTYVTKIVVGADSLGAADRWTDNKTVSQPDYKPSRTVIANVRQTKVKPATKIVKRKINLGPQNKGSFGSATNREKPTVSSYALEPAYWKTGTQTLSSITEVVRPPAVILNRLAKMRNLQ